jgi:hypothetical protein
VFVRVVSDVFEKCSLSGIQVQAAENPSFLPLIGAARSLAGITVGVAAVADFGGTRAKRGLAFYDLDGNLQHMKVLPTCGVAALNASGKTAALAEEMVALLAETLSFVPQGQPLISKVLVSLAAYVEDGKPLNLERGAYYALNVLSSNISAWFSERLSQVSGRAVQVEFLHDCDAAAVALAGKELSAVVMLGSALGVGFVPPEDGVRRISSTFTLINLGQEGDLQSSRPNSSLPEKWI